MPAAAVVRPDGLGQGHAQKAGGQPHGPEGDGAARPGQSTATDSSEKGLHPFRQPHRSQADGQSQQNVLVPPVGPGAVEGQVVDRL